MQQHETEQQHREEYDSFLIPPPQATNQPDTEDDDDQPLQLVETDGKRQLVGYAVVWGATSSPRRDGYRHRFSRGSITWSTPTLALWHHDPATPLASTANGTVTITEDDYGAKVVIDLDDTSAGQDAYKRVQNRLVAGMSFGGVRNAFAKTDDRTVIDVTDFAANEVSLTIIPAMTATNIVTAANTDELKKNPAPMQELSAVQQKNNLDRIKLALLKPTGRASA